MIYYFMKLSRLFIVSLFKKQFSRGLSFKLSQPIPQCIILDHTSITTMHFGDLLFFLEIVWTSNQSNIPVYLVGSGQLKDFFQFLMYNIDHRCQIYRQVLC